MFFRYVNTRRKAIDLDRTFSGACFLLGGAPQLMEVKDKLVGIPIVKMAVNNTATIVRPDIWLGADIPSNYSDSVLMDPAPMKFTVITRRSLEVSGKPWNSIPNTYFVSTVKMSHKRFFQRNRDFSWDKNIFTMAMQLAFRLGFKTLYTVGCSFEISKGSQYCYETELNDKQIRYNQRTYNNTIERISKLLPYAKAAGFELVSCTPNSKLNNIVRYVDLDSAIIDSTATIPYHNTISCRHPA